MAILAECPVCHRRLSIKKKTCPCGVDLDKEKRNRKVRFCVIYRTEEGKQQWRSLASFKDVDPYSLTEARKVEAKVNVCKKEKRLDVFDIRKETNATFKQLADWYLNLEEIKELASYKTVRVYLNKFTRELGGMKVKDVKLEALVSLQVKRKKEGYKPKTIDDEINYAKGMIIKAFYNDKVSGDTLKAFQRVKPRLKRHSNKRDRVLTPSEYECPVNTSPKHLSDIITMGYWTGMRKGEIIGLTWDKVDLKERLIRLKATDTKEKESKTVPIGEEVFNVLNRLPRPIHGGFVFLYTGEPILKRFETAMKTACEKAGIIWGKEEEGGFIFHDLRHTFITDMRRAGVPRTVTMSITGHAIKDMNERYDTVEDWEKIDAVKKLSAYRQGVSRTVSNAPTQEPQPIDSAI